MSDQQLNYADIKAEFNLTWDGDAWGTVMQWWFAIADEITFNRPDLECPEEWQYRPSPLGPSNDPDSYETEIIQNTTDAALMRFGLVLSRYADKLRLAGQDY